MQNQILRLGTVHKLKKHTFNFANGTSNIACRAELGHFPLSITITQKLLNYILYIQSKTEDSFVKQTFLMSFDLHSSGKSSFHSHLMKISKYFNLPDFNVNLLDTAIVKTFIRLMKQKYISYTRIVNLRCRAGLWVSTKFNWGITTVFVCTCVCYRY